MSPWDAIKPGSSPAEDPLGFWDLLLLLCVFVVPQICPGWRNDEGQPMGVEQMSRGQGRAKGCVCAGKVNGVFHGGSQQ